MALNSKTEIGKKGEEMAVTYLRKRGYKILATNWHFHHLEIDIVALDGDEIVFVEVKTRTSTAFGNPEEAVSQQKINRILDAAEAYIEKYDIDREARFDIMAILLPYQAAPKLEYFEDAFMA